MSQLCQSVKRALVSVRENCCAQQAKGCEVRVEGLCKMRLTLVNRKSTSTSLGVSLCLFFNWTRQDTPLLKLTYRLPKQPLSTGLAFKAKSTSTIFAELAWGLAESTRSSRPSLARERAIGLGVVSWGTRRDRMIFKQNCSGSRQGSYTSRTLHSPVVVTEFNNSDRLLEGIQQLSQVLVWPLYR